MGMHLINIRSTPTNSSAPPCKDLHPFARRGDLRAGGGTCILAGAVLVEILACEQGARVHACMRFKGGTGRHCHAVCHGAAQRERHSCSIAPPPHRTSGRPPATRLQAERQRNATGWAATCGGRRRMGMPPSLSGSLLVAGVHQHSCSEVHHAGAQAPNNAAAAPWKWGCRARVAHGHSGCPG